MAAGGVSLFGRLVECHGWSTRRKRRKFKKCTVLINFLRILFCNLSHGGRVGRTSAEGGNIKGSALVLVLGDEEVRRGIFAKFCTYTVGSDYPAPALIQLHYMILIIEFPSHCP